MQWGRRRCALDPFAGGELGEISRCCGLALDEHCGGDRAVVAAGNWLEDLLFQHLSSSAMMESLATSPKAVTALSGVMWLVSHEAW
jgi:hypothetical protein